MSEKRMKVRTSKGYLPNIKYVDIGLCEDCVLGKHKKVSFTKTVRDLHACKLELIHTDVWGPVSVHSLGGSRYHITFIDDPSCKIWVYFLKNKSEVFSSFKKWKAEVENECGLKIKYLKSDNGGEYDSKEFKIFCAENNIKMLRTVPNRPQ
ncbi:Retrovirus-related Pol polyprotein from transposon TNT 1-94 [Apostasia shenzhenica]|uniref:Retrovirus-related Pol polyprotein from transposon TNT 1-94 n=1 Tax=Apostasia shenzhenica TaxID=1088818 RepID=A0A2I0AUM6_9ASPA|nr:Retrovirus-related Pol polyprotein from transposon TNT 1-94 [Apostasia shenzhenica]